ncbi:hypothetical protein B0T21DRAFT_300749 [Apiosordaria backusii]|uniref:LysM domain-containing protein n=1 Tax=Apiosordaria backusii TaxID=314023 RepID=A0AA39ZP93_9PEZI|nr:hypothetical protein B0T21DRAFT_300749 [Apiosordaria backusii]
MLLFTTTALAKVWDRDIWKIGRRIGGGGGSEFEMVAETGATVQKIRVFRKASSTGKQSLRGIRVTFSDGATQSAGVLEGESKDYDFQQGEVITDMILWGDGEAKRTGRILFHTSTGGEFDHGQDTTGQGNFVMDIGSGMLIGFVGRAGKDIDKLAPVFIKTLAKNPILENVRLEPFDVNEGLELQTLDEVEEHWNGAAFTFNFEGKTTREVSTTWTTEVTMGLTAGMSLTAGVPGIGSAEMSVSWSVGLSSSQEMSVSRAEELTWAITHLVSGPHDAVRCSAQVWRGELSVGWEGVLVLDTGVRIYRLPTRGNLKRLDVSKIIKSCEKLNPEIADPGTTQSASSTPTPASSGFMTIITASNPSFPSTTAVVVQPGTISDCVKFHTIVPEDTCASIAKGAGITLEEFYSWNKEVTSGVECDNLYLGYKVCVGVGA